MRRLAGKRLRTEYFTLKDGQRVQVELRIDDNDFYMQIGEGAWRAKSVAELRAMVLPELERIHAQTWRPVILLNYEDHEGRHSSYYSHGSEDDRVALHLSFRAGWVTEQADASNYHQWRQVEVPDGAAALPAFRPDTRHHDQLRDDDYRRLMPWTQERWRALQRIYDALLAIRRRIADVMEDAAGGKLDEIARGETTLFLAAPPKETKEVSRGRR